ncbi:quinon protein alcohol dehydrogenase-like superfamily, partial [Baffinella frigidus]
GHWFEITAMAISDRGDRIASADTDGVVLLWDAGTAAVLHKIQFEYCEPMAIAFSPDGLYFVVTGTEGHNTLRWKDFATPGCDGGVTSLSFSLDGKQLASAGEDKFVRLWNPRDGSRLKAFRQYE